MDKYTPTTEEFWDTFLFGARESSDLELDEVELRNMFVRWMRTIKAKAWDEGFDEGEDYGLGIILAPGNPYRSTE